MKQSVLLFLISMLSMPIWAQTTKMPQEQVTNVYRATTDIINDLQHTKLQASFDYEKAQLNGKVWLTFKPHFYTTDSLQLDAKGMDIKQVAVVKGSKNISLKYDYDGLLLNITLDKPYHRNEKYIIYIDYTAKPNSYTAKGSAAITDAKGLYFINPKGEEKDKPTQIWTQGETEATSVWVPTIDKPNQKTTQEFYLTVPSKYVSLSNGKLVSSIAGAGNTRTDYWKMDLPHAPYLFFIGVGDYAIIKDKYKDKEVSYYVEKEYAPVARQIFGNTPEMMKFFSTITGVDYPWNKYAQIVGRDYVSGAMENTTATLHQESAQQDARELSDGNDWENTIAHELFHQWFGDLVTSESWSNLTLNESFANYSEYLWTEYKYGKDAADAHNYEDMQGYLFSNSDKKNLVRYNYNDKEDMFDAVSYNKGGRILHMLRNYVGDSAFFKSLNNYLTSNKFKSAEAHQLRLAFEEVTGKDLNPFWNQWYFGAGHPKLDISYNYLADKKLAQVIVAQTQSSGKIFTLPVAVDVYVNGDRKRYNVSIDNKMDTILFPAETKPNLINFDAENILLAEKKESKSMEEYLFQFNHARNYMDRREAIDAAAKKQEEAKAVEIMMSGLKDPYAGIRKYTIQKLDLKKEAVKTLAEQELAHMAKSDADRLVKAAAIERLSNYGFAKYLPLYQSAVNDSSYAVAGNALDAISKIDSTLAYNEAKKLAQQPAKGELANAITKTMILFGDESSAEMILKNFESMPVSQEKLEALQPMAQFLVKTSSQETLQRGVNAIIDLKDQIPAAYKEQIAPIMDTILRNIQKAKVSAGQKEQADYIEKKLTPASTKGF